MTDFVICVYNTFMCIFFLGIDCYFKGISILLPVGLDWAGPSFSPSVNLIGSGHKLFAGVTLLTFN